MRSLHRMPRLAQAVGIVALAGMAYCHVKDVGMKFDEHVYYMATLFCCNIAASLLLIPAVAAFGDRGDRRAGAVWAAAGALALFTIAGFLWSRTIGFPKMEDHVGEWDSLGLTSLAFEAVIVLVSVTQLRAFRVRTKAMIPTGSHAIAGVPR
jgi:peptidoglycan/LPS O-acetylase OafA/YrhL